MSETKTLREQALENLGVNTPTWIIEAAESLAESYASPLRERVAELEVLIDQERGHTRQFSDALDTSNYRLGIMSLENQTFRALMQEFVDRVDRGAARSKRTYQAFKKALDK